MLWMAQSSQLCIQSGGGVLRDSKPATSHIANMDIRNQSEEEPEAPGDQDGRVE